MGTEAFKRVLAGEIVGLQNYVRSLAEASASATAALGRIEHEEEDDHALLDHLTDAKSSCENAFEILAAIRGMYDGWAAAKEVGE